MLTELLKLFLNWIHAEIRYALFLVRRWRYGAHCALCSRETAFIIDKPGMRRPYVMCEFHGNEFWGVIREITPAMLAEFVKAGGMRRRVQ